ncbi:MAG: class II aldolase/adducin family protein [Dehalococcoidia bacterium]
MQEVGRDLYRLALVSSHGGNLSIRNRLAMWITGTGTMLGHLESRHISLAHAGGEFEGPAPSTDTVLHAAVYALGGFKAIVHAHPRHAIAISDQLDVFEPPDFEGRLHLERVPVVAPGPTQTETIAAALQTSRAVVLRDHGAYARGDDLWEALHWITALEESAEIESIRRATRPRGS